MHTAVRGARVENNSAWATVFQYFRQFNEKTMAKPFQTTLLRGYTMAIITAHAPLARQHMWPSPGPWPYSKEVRCSC